MKFLVTLSKKSEERLNSKYPVCLFDVSEPAGKRRWGGGRREDDPVLHGGVGVEIIAV